jgi:hypothetical protein
MTEASHWPTPADLADAASELEEEKGERALALSRAIQQVNERKEWLRASVAEGAPWAPALITTQAQRLIVALDEVERLGGVA